MKPTRKFVTKKTRGRPATGHGIQVGERWSTEAVERIDDWRASQPDMPGRPEAIRRLVELGLTVKTKSPSSTAAAAGRAKELAAKAIDGLTRGGTDVEEKANRKRRLLKGPEEFRDMRTDRAKPKGK